MWLVVFELSLMGLVCFACVCWWTRVVGCGGVLVVVHAVCVWLLVWLVVLFVCLCVRV